MTYDDLKEQWTNYMHRTNLTDQYDFATALILSRLGRDLRVQENEHTDELTISDIDVGVPMPAGYRETRELTTMFQAAPRPLDFYSPVQFDSNGLKGGRPQIYTIKAGVLYIKGAGDVALTYWRNPEDIVVTGTSASLDAYPDLYLYSGLAELNRFVQDKEAAINFTSYYKEELRIANDAAVKQRIGNRPVMRAV